MTTSIHRLPRLRIGERPLDIEVSCEYGNKQRWTKSRAALWQGIVPVKPSMQGYAEKVSAAGYWI